ncbi:hypothetical protein D9M68_754640 [compost metagenome]
MLAQRAELHERAAQRGAAGEQRFERLLFEMQQRDGGAGGHVVATRLAGQRRYFAEPRAAAVEVEDGLARVGAGAGGRKWSWGRERFRGDKYSKTARAASVADLHPRALTRQPLVTTLTPPSTAIHCPVMCLPASLAWSRAMPQAPPG